MSSSHALHASLLRPAVIHILRAAGFHSCKPSVLDTVTDLAARHLFLLASNTAAQVYDRTTAFPDHPDSVSKDLSSITNDDTNIRPLPSLDDASPTVSDVRLALASASVFTTSRTPAEEAWTEELRPPLSEYPSEARMKERLRRDTEDTRDIQDFIDWISGPVNREIRRIAGLLAEETDIVAAAAGESKIKEDYLTALKKKHSKTADNARYAGTVLGKASEERPVMKIEGGPATLSEWRTDLKRKREEQVKSGAGDGPPVANPADSAGHVPDE